MPSFWVDLLYLHGHISDPQWLRRPASRPTTQPPVEPPATKAPVSRAKRTIMSLRLCLGIGDGALHFQ